MRIWRGWLLLTLATLFARPAVAGFSTGQAADLVIGQSVFNSNTANNNPSGSSLNNGGGIWVSTSLAQTFVADYSNNRVLIYNTTAPVNGRTADVVLGQVDFFHNTANYGGISAASLYGPISLSVYQTATSTYLFVADYNNNRVLEWNGIPTSNNAAAGVVIGQSGFATNSGGSDAVGLSNPRGVLAVAGKLYIADFSNNRVKVHNTIPTVNGAAADFVIGQSLLGGCIGEGNHSNCSSYGNNNHDAAAPNAFFYPIDVFVSTVAGKTFIVDENNNRVLVYYSTAPSLQTAPNLVLGQPDFQKNECNTGGGPTAQTLCAPSSVWVSSDGVKIAVSDEGNHRVLLWNTLPTVNGQAADVVVGQANMTSNGAGSGAAQLYSPMRVWYDAVSSQLFIADWNNHRVWVKNGLPAANGASADFVLGQTSTIGSSGANRGAGSPAADTLNYPRATMSGLDAGGNNYLYVSDFYNYRVLVYSLPITMNAQPAFRVLGQPDFVTRTQNNGGTSATSLAAPSQIFYSSNTLYVSDGGNWCTTGEGNNRVLVWTSSVTANQQAASFVIGQPNFGTQGCNQGGLSNKTLYGWWDWPGIGIWASTSTVAIADPINNRVLFFSSITVNGQGAAAVLGQPGMGYNDANNRGITNRTLYGPQSVASDGTRLYVADYYNHRVMVFDLPVTQNQPIAHFVLGQSSFTFPEGAFAPGTDACNWNGISNQSMCNPSSVWVSSFGSSFNLYVGEWSNSRVQVWTSSISSIDQASNFVMGQPSASAGACNNGGVTSQSLCNVSNEIWGDQNGVWVSDWNNNRILDYQPPPSANNAPATSVVGQANMTSNSPFSGASPFSMNSYYWSRAVVSDGTRLATVDSGNNRVMIWNTLPTTNGQGADLVLGQSNMSNNGSNQGGLTASSLSNPYGVWWDGRQFFVSDTSNQRVLVWNGWPTSMDQAANYVIGQTTFNVNPANSGSLQLGLYTPEGLYSDGQRLWVTDWSNNRVVAYNLPITANQPAAVLVLGQPGWSTNSCNQGGISANSICNPSGVNFDGEHLFVADYGNHRVLQWNSRPTTNGQAADLVLGQPNFTANTCNNGGVNAGTLCCPSATYSDGSRLYVSDLCNHRTLFWNSIPSVTQQNADGALGKPNLNNNGCCAMTSTDETYPDGSFLVGSLLWQQDNWYHRVLRYTSSATNLFSVAITSGMAPASLTQSTAPVAAFKLHVNAPSSALTWTRLTIYNNSPSLPDQSLQVRVYKENDGNDVFDSGDTPVSALVPMGAGKANLFFSQALNTNVATYYVAVYVNPSYLPFGPAGFPAGSIKLFHNLSSFGFAQAGVELGGATPVDIAYNSGSFTPVDAPDTVVFGATSPIAPSPLGLLNNTTGFVMGTIQLQTQNDFAFLTSLVVNRVGAANDADVAGMSLWLDANNNGILDAGDVNLMSSSSPFAGGQAFLSPTTPLQISTNVAQYLIVADLAGSALNTTFGIEVDSTSLQLNGVDVVGTAQSTTPFNSYLYTLRPALSNVSAVVPTAAWWNTTFTLTASNIGTQASFYRFAFDQSPTHSWTNTETQWTVGQTTVAAGSSGQNWYFHARAYNSGNQGGGAQDLGPFWADVTAPAGSAFAHWGSTGGALGEATWDALAAGTSAQLTVQDAASGLGPAGLAATAGYWGFDEGAGSSAADRGSGGNSVAFSGVPAWTAGRYGSAASLNGSTRLATSGAPSGLALGNGARSCAAWVYPTAYSNSTHTILGYGTGSAGAGSWCGLSGTSAPPAGRMAMGFYANDRFAAGNALPLNQWSHVAMTYDGANITFYLNGAQVDQGPPPGGAPNTASSLPLDLGAPPWDGSSAGDFAGRLDDVRLYNRALSAAEVLTLYTSPALTPSVSVSTTAGAQWTTYYSTIPAASPYFSLTGSSGTLAPQTLALYNAALARSTNTTVCGGSACDATNQIKFSLYDVSGNFNTFGPFAWLVDTPVDSATPTLTSPVNGGYVGQTQPTFSWVHPSTSTFPGLSNYFLQVSSYPTFTPLVISISSPVIYGVPNSSYASTTSLASATTYYWRVRVNSFGGVLGPYSAVSTFQTDFAPPTGSAFVSFNSTGGALVDYQFNDLSASVTAQLTVQDVLTGLNLTGAPDASTLGLWQFEEAVGNQARSSIGGGDPGTLTGGASWGTGRWGRGAGLDGASGYVSVAHNAKFNASSLTVEAWVKPNATLAADTAFVHKGNANFGWYLGYVGGQLAFWSANNAALSCGVNAACVTATVPGGAWSHVAGTYDGVTLSLYLNGALVASATYTGGIGLNTDPINMGAYKGTGQFLAGVLDDVRLTAGARSSAQIQADARGGTPALVMLSNDAGTTWKISGTTWPTTAGGLFLNVAGNTGTNATQPFQARNVALAQSTSTLTGAAATNEVKFLITDVAGNLMTAGPYGLLFDSASLTALSTPTAPGNTAYVNGSTPTFNWQTAALASVVQYELQASNDPLFGSTVLDITTPAVYGLPIATYTATTALAEGATFYWRVQARTNLNRNGPWSQSFSFVTDYTAPSTGTFSTINPAGPSFSETQFTSLASGVTAQLTVQDLVSGLNGRPQASAGELGRWHFEEGSGLTADDSIAGNNGALSAGAMWTTGRLGRGLTTAGGNYVQLSTYTGVAWNGMTVAAWLYPTNATTYNTAWSSKQYEFLADGSAGKVNFYPRATGTGGCMPSTGASYPLNQWSHVAFVADPASNTNKIYVNGLLAGSCSGAGTPVDTNFRFGLDGLSGIGGADSFNGGKFDEFAIFPRALTAAQVAAEASASAGVFEARYSTNAGATWNLVRTTATASTPYISLTGPYGSNGLETMQAVGLNLSQSLTAATCGGVAPCSATDQLQFTLTDRAGNVFTAGPYAVLIDSTASVALSTPAYPSGVIAPGAPGLAFLWNTPSTAALSGLTSFVLEASRSPGFSPLDVSISTPNLVTPAAAYVSTYTLVEGTSYYWRVRALDYLGNASPNSATGSFLVDSTSPTAQAFAFISSTGGVMGEIQAADLITGVTAQLTVADAGSGLTLASGFGVTYSTTAGASWIEWSSAAVAASLGQTRILALTAFGGNLYAGTGNGGQVLRSPDGVNWSAVLTGTGETQVYALAVFNGKLYAATGGAGRIYATSNGTTWSQVLGGTGDSQVRSLVVFDGRLYAGTASSGGLVYSSADGATWTQLLSGTGDTGKPSMAVFNGKLYVGTQGTGRVYSTFDGANWTYSTIPDTATTVVNTLAVYNNKLFAGAGPSGRVYASADGVSWTAAVSTVPFTQVYALAPYAGKLYIGGDSAKLLAYDGTTSYVSVPNVGDGDVDALLSYSGSLYAGTGPNSRVLQLTPLTVNLTGTEGTPQPQTLSVTGLSLVQSNTTALCFGVSPCAATDQLRFTVSDRAGNVRASGPYAILVDTVIAAAQPLAGQTSGVGVASLKPEFHWKLGPTVSLGNITGFEFQLDTNPGFTSIVGSSVTAYRYAALPFNLTNGTTYYWHARAFDVAGATSAFSVTQAVVVDTDAPTATSFATLDPVSGPVGEAVQVSLAAGVTSQLTIQDWNSGIQRNGPAPLTAATGTVVLWHLDDTGATASDSGPNGDNAAITGAAWVNGRFGRGLRFAGNSGSVAAVGYNATLAVSSVTVEAWLNSTARGAGWILDQDGGSRTSYALYLESNGSLTGWFGASSANCAGTRVNDGAWHHLALTFASGTGRVYLDGSACASVAAAISPTTSALALAERAGGAGPYLDGVLDEVRVLNRALSAAEIAADVATGQPFTVQYSTNAGASWVFASSIAFSGAQLDQSARTLQALGLNLASSTNGVVCGGVAPCGATNQIRFYFSDGAGNLKAAGPYAILVDTSMAAPTAVAPGPGVAISTPLPAFGWSEVSPVAQHEVQVSTDGFATLVFSSVTSNASLLSVVPLVHGQAYSWRARGVDAIGLRSAFSGAGAFTVDLVAPTAGSFAAFSSTGVAQPEGSFIDLAAGATAQIVVQDALSGLPAPALGLQADGGTLGLWPLNEGAGLTTVDASGSGNTGTLQGGASWTAGRYAFGLQLAGGQRVNVPYSAGLNAASVMTIEAWARTTNAAPAAADGQGLVTRWVSGGGFMLMTGRAGSGGAASFSVGGSSWVVGARNVSDGAWHHVAATYDGTVARLYVDGALDGSAWLTNQLPNTVTPLAIGDAPGDPAAASFVGSVDDVRLLNYARSAAQLYADYAGSPAFYAELSTTAANSFQVVGATSPAGPGAPYLTLTGAPGSTAPQTLQAVNLTLAPSTSAVVCGGVAPCGATNQLIFFLRDAAGNYAQAGPFALLVDTQLSLPFAGSPINDTIVSTNTPLLTWSEKASQPLHLVQISTDPAFGTLTWSTSTSAGFGLAPTLATQTTYYWRVRAQDSAGIQTVFSTASVFQVDPTAPVASGYSVTNATGGVLAETQWDNLAQGVTVQAVIRDLESGLAISPAGFSVMYTTNAGGSWTDFASTAAVLSGTGEQYVISLATFSGRLYAGTYPSARVYSSADGVNWTLALSGTGESQIQSLAAFNGKLYAGTSPGGKVLATSDGVTWTTALSGTGETDVRALLSFNGRLWAGTGPNAKVYSTADGAAWSQRLSGTGESFIQSLAGFNGRLYAGTSPNAKAYATADGFNWQAALTGTGETAIQSLAAFSGRLFAGTSPSARVYATADGATWTQSRPAPGETAINSLAVFNGKLYAGTSNNAKLYASPDGFNWANVLSGTGESYLYTLAPFNGKLYAGTIFSALVLQLTPNAAVMTGSDGTNAAQTLSLNLNLVQSTNTQTCGGTWACGATDQVVLAGADRGGNARSYGPFAVLVDTSVPQPQIASLTSLTTDSILVNLNPVIDGLSGTKDYQYYISTSAAFAAPVTTSPVVTVASYTFTGLQQVTTYYVRASARDNLLNVSPYSVVSGTSTIGIMFFSTADISSPNVYQGLAAPMIRLTMNTAPAQPVALFNRVVVTRSGGADADVTQVEIWSDSVGDGIFREGTDVLLAAAPLSGGVAAVNLGSNQQTVGSTAKNFFVVYRLSPTSVIGDALLAQLAGPTAVGFANPYRVPGAFPMTSGSSTILDGPNALLITPVSMAPATAQPGQADVPLLRLRLKTDQGTSQLSKIVLNLIGSAGSNEISAIKIYRDNNSNGQYDPGIDGLVTSGSDAFLAGVSTVNFTAQASSITVSPQQQDYFVTVNVAATATSGDTFGIQLATGTMISLADSDTGYLLVIPATSTLVQVVQPNNLSVQFKSMIPPAVSQGLQYAVMKASVTVDIGRAYLTGFTLNRTGTSLDSDVSKVSIYADAAPPSAGGYYNPGIDVLLGTAAFSGGVASIPFTAQTLSPGTTYVFFMVYDVNPLANAGDTIGASLTNSNYVMVQSTLTTIVGTFPVASSTAAINATVNTLLVPTALDLTTGGLLQGATNVAVLRLDLRANQNALLWTGLTLRRSGGAPDSDITAVKVWSDANANFQLDTGTDTLISSGNDVFTGGVANISFPSAQAIGVSSRTYFVSLSVAAGANPGDMVGVQLSTPTDILVSVPNVVSSATTPFPITAGPTPVQQYPNTITVTTGTIAPANANPGTANVGMLKLTVNTNVSNAIFQGLRLDRVGGSDADVAAVKVYYDINQIGSFNSGSVGSYLLLTSTTASFAGGTVNLAFSTPTVIGTSPRTFYAAIDLSTAAAPTDAIALRLLSQTYLSVNAPNTVAATQAQTAPVTINAPPSLVYITAASSAPAVAPQSATNVPILQMTARMAQYTGVWSGLTLLRSGSSVDSDVARVKLYFDANGDGVLEPLLDTLVATGTFSAGQATLSFIANQSLTVSTKTFFLAYDISGTATPGGTLGAQIGGPGSVQVAFPNGVANVGFPISSGLVQIQPTQSGIFVTSQDKAPAALMQGATNQIMLSLLMNTTAYAAPWTTLQLTRLGSASDTDITAIHIWADNNSNGVIDAGDTEITSGNDRFIGGAANILLGAQQSIGVTPASYLVAVDVNMFAASTTTFGVQIASSASFGITAPNYVVNAGFPISTSLSPLTKRPDALLLQATSLVPAGINQGAEVPMAKLTASAQRDTVNWAQLRLARQGSLADGFVNRVNVYLDNGNGVFDAADVLVGTGTFASGVANVRFNAVQRMTTAQQTYWVTFVFDPAATVGNTIGFSLPDSSYLLVLSPDYSSGAGLPFNSATAPVLDARTPTTPFVQLDGPYWKSFETMHFVWSSSVTLGSITNVQYAIGTTAGGTQLVPYTTINPITTNFTAQGLALQTATTYYVSVKAQSSFGFISAAGVSAPILVDLAVPTSPNLSATIGQTSVLLSWTPVPPGPSGMMGYLVEYQNGDSPLWRNAKNNQPSPGTPQVSALSPTAAAPAVGPADVIPSLSFSLQPTNPTIIVRVRAVSGSGVVGPPSAEQRLLVGTLPAGGISSVSSFPNPFDSRKEPATINYTLSASADVVIKIFSVYGNLVKELHYASGGNGGQAGANNVTWDGGDNNGQKTSKGVYIAVLQSGGAKAIHKIALIH